MKPSSVVVCADCGHQNGFLRCACEDGYTWFPPACLDPQKCYLHTAGSLQTCDCHLKNLTRSVNFCERTSKHVRIPGGSSGPGSLPPQHMTERELYLALCPCVSLFPRAELVFAGRWKDTDDIPLGLAGHRESCIGAEISGMQVDVRAPLQPCSCSAQQIYASLEI